MFGAFPVRRLPAQALAGGSPATGGLSPPLGLQSRPRPRLAGGRLRWSTLVDGCAGLGSRSRDGPSQPRRII